MRKLSILLILFGLMSCAKSDETYLKATYRGIDLVKSSIKIEKKYDLSKNELQIWFYYADSMATICQYNFQSNGGAYVGADLRFKYKKFYIIEGLNGKLSKDNNKVNGTLIAPKNNGLVEFKNYQL